MALKIAKARKRQHDQKIALACESACDKLEKKTSWLYRAVKNNDKSLLMRIVTQLRFRVHFDASDWDCGLSNANFNYTAET